MTVISWNVSEMTHSLECNKSANNIIRIQNNKANMPLCLFGWHENAALSTLGYLISFRTTRSCWLVAETAENHMLEWFGWKQNIWRLGCVQAKAQRMGKHCRGSESPMPKVAWKHLCGHKHRSVCHFLKPTSTAQYQNYSISRHICVLIAADMEPFSAVDNQGFWQVLHV